MSSTVPFQPAGYQRVIPYIHSSDASKLIAFLKHVFDAVEIAVYPRPDGKIGHAAFRIGDSVIELADGGPDWPAMPCALQVYVPDLNAAYDRALRAGATTLQPPTNQLYGDRTASIRDSSGNNWYLAQQVEIVSKEEVDRRIAAMSKK
jgi:PhnB protein